MVSHGVREPIHHLLIDRLGTYREFEQKAAACAEEDCRIGQTPKPGASR